MLIPVPIPVIQIINKYMIKNLVNLIQKLEKIRIGNYNNFPYGDDLNNY